MHYLFTGLLRPVFYSGCFLVLFALSLNVNAQTSQQLPSISLQVNQITLQAELAQTESQRAQGLMFRQRLGVDSGMLFAFDHPIGACFWMKNTPLPLSIAFITEQGTISNIEHMQPFSPESHCPIVPIKYALEMEQGWFAQKGILAGDTVRSLPK